jgi:ArsR family transcriptional regulator, arsenate/arsenite/antimonite-responsive transcriptional repressor / arsenate reductase (thioredoxin)
MRSRRMRPVLWSISYLFRDPIGISTTTSTSMAGSFGGSSRTASTVCIGPEQVYPRDTLVTPRGLHQASLTYHAIVTAAGASVPPPLRLIADPVRWRLLRELAQGDLRVRELMAALGEPQNLVSYHLRRLHTGGLVTARRSSFDGRDVYYSLDFAGCAQALAGAAAALHPGLRGAAAGGGAVEDAGPRAPRQVLFVCTGNSGRSPMAAALLGHSAGRQVRAASAGTRPGPLHPTAAAVLRDRYRIDISGHRPTHVTAVASTRFDCVISLCDKAREACPEFAGSPRRIHWSLPDPAAAAASPRAAYAGFEHVADELSTRIRYLLPTLTPEFLDRG